MRALRTFSSFFVIETVIVVITIDYVRLVIVGITVGISSVGVGVVGVVGLVTLIFITGLENALKRWGPLRNCDRYE